MFDVSRRTVWQAVKNLEEVGIIEKLKLSEKYIDHTYSYTFKEREYMPEMTVSNEKNFSNSNNKNNKLFLYKSLINQEAKKSEKEMRKIPQEALQKTNLGISSNDSAPVVTIREMYDAVNEILGKKLSFRLTKEIARWMGMARNTYFQTLEKWRDFLQAIKESAYLTGEKFLLTIKWLLRFKTIERILGGEYNFEQKRIEKWNRMLAREREAREEEEKEKEREQMQNAINEIENSGESEKCMKARYNLLKRIGVERFNTWFANATFEEKDGKVIARVADEFKLHGVYTALREKVKDLNIEFGLSLKYREKAKANGENPAIVDAKFDLIDKIGSTFEFDGIFSDLKFREENGKVIMKPLFSYVTYRLEEALGEDYENILKKINIEIEEKEEKIYSPEEMEEMKRLRERLYRLRKENA